MKGLKLTRLFVIIANEEQTQRPPFEIEKALHDFSLRVFSLSKLENDLIDAYREINSTILKIELIVLKKKRNDCHLTFKLLKLLRSELELIKLWTSKLYLQKEWTFKLFLQIKFGSTIRLTHVKFRLRRTSCI